MLLVDSSVWIDYLRKPPSPAKDWMRATLGDRREAVVGCEPVTMELLAGIPHSEFIKAEILTNGLPALPMDPAQDFRQAATFFRAARASGQTIRGLLDCLICAIAARHGATLVHKDKDFEVLCRVARVQSIDLREVAGQPPA